MYDKHHTHAAGRDPPDPDTGLRWAMRDYAALVRGIAAASCPGRNVILRNASPMYLWRCGATPKRSTKRQNPRTCLAHRHRTQYGDQPLPQLAAARHPPAHR